jgi:RNA polymerase sigma factor (sigma-70 family)
MPPALSERSESQGLPDAELVRRATAGDREAFAAIYERHRTVVYRFARLMSGSNATAEDVTQEVFVTLIRTLPSYEPQRAGLRTYLYGVARNVTRNRLRRDRRFVALDTAARIPCSSADDPHDAAARAQEHARLRRVILSLPSRYREVIILSDVQGLAYAEAASILQVPVGTVRSRLSRGRQMIALTLRRTEAPEERPVVREKQASGLGPQALAEASGLRPGA